MMSNPLGKFPFRACLTVGVGLGGFFDGIVFHQLLQWHHVVSSWYPATSLENLRINTVWDGVFHSGVYALLVLALFRVWQISNKRYVFWSGPLIAGSLLMGWGTFNLLEGLIDHHLLGMHHVNETAAVSQWIFWDVGFLLWGMVMVVVGWLLWRDGRRAHLRQADILRSVAQLGGGL